MLLSIAKLFIFRILTLRLGMSIWLSGGEGRGRPRMCPPEPPPGRAWRRGAGTGRSTSSWSNSPKSRLAEKLNSMSGLILRFLLSVAFGGGETVPGRGAFWWWWWCGWGVLLERGAGKGRRPDRGWAGHTAVVCQCLGWTPGNLGCGMLEICSSLRQASCQLAGVVGATLVWEGSLGVAVVGDMDGLAQGPGPCPGPFASESCPPGSCPGSMAHWLGGPQSLVYPGWRVAGWLRGWGEPVRGRGGFPGGHLLWVRVLTVPHRLPPLCFHLPVWLIWPTRGALQAEGCRLLLRACPSTGTSLTLTDF